MSKTNTKVSITYFGDENMIEIKSSRREFHYQITEDKYTGDWSVFRKPSDDTQFSQQTYILTKQGCIQFALAELGVIANPTYERAPDRTSA